MRILIVDDESLNRFLLLHMLEQEGYTDCYEAESGQEAITLTAKINPDIILLDVQMPNEDGFAIAPQLKKLGGDIYLPIIFITALDDQKSLARCLEVGGDDFTSKPFDKVILTAKIRAHARSRLLSKKTHEQNQRLTYYQNSVEREHAIVEHIFKNALTINEKVKDLFDYRLAPASNFNGDLFLIENSPSGGLYCLMGDFTGHGLASAIGALPVTRAFQAMARKGLALAEMAATINSTLLPLLPDDMFFAAALIEISSSGQRLSVWNGGMPHLILLDQRGKICHRFISMHMALGILDGDEFENKVEHFEAKMGDRLIGYSDGVIELTNDEGVMLGEEGLETWLQADPGIKMKCLSDKVQKYKGLAEQEDDITLVAYTCQPLPGLERNKRLSTLPVNIDVTLYAEQIKQYDPVQALTDMLASQQGMNGVRSDFFTVLSELYNNSVDHGILQLDSKLKKDPEGFFEFFEMRTKRLEELSDGEINIKLSFCPKERLLRLFLKDSGSGFDVNKVSQPGGEDDMFGRGLELIRELTSELTYSEKGCQVEASFNI